MLRPDGTKKYLPTTDEDLALYAQAKKALKRRNNAYPLVAIEPGYNTNQALGYNYRHWHEMFNARQLLCLSILAKRISRIPDPTLRELFTCLLSGTLEFNNMFASYKGEGTGAVRHMFAHHVLKPERVPLEANLWGTPKSSGSFSTMFEGRIRRALDYADKPFEIRPGRNGRKANEKVYGLSEKIGFPIADNYDEFAQGERVYLSCADSSATDLPDASVDAVLTDPPFFDNVHYSQLADFFHVWQRHILGPNGHWQSYTTRCERRGSESGRRSLYGPSYSRMDRGSPRPERRRHFRVHLPPLPLRRLAVCAARPHGGRIRYYGSTPHQVRDVCGDAEASGQRADRS